MYMCICYSGAYFFGGSAIPGTGDLSLVQNCAAKTHTYLKQHSDETRNERTSLNLSQLSEC